MTAKMLLSARDMIARAMLEEEFQAHVTGSADALRWAWYHTHDSRRSTEGFPDLFMASPTQGRQFLAELKRETTQLTLHQLHWASILYQTGEYYIWRPSDWLDDLVIDVLQGRRLAEAKARTLDYIEAEHRRKR